MTERGSPENFDCAPAHRIAANERVVNLQFETFDLRISRIEKLMERLEKRLWLTAYGVVGTILAQAFQSFLAATP